MTAHDLPQFQDLVDRLDFATMAELVAVAQELDDVSARATDRGCRAMILTIGDLLMACADHRNHDLETGLREIIDAGRAS